MSYSADDPLVGDAQIPFFQWLNRHGFCADLHVYATGGHGYGTELHGRSSDYWIHAYYHWLSSLGLISD